MLMKRVILRFLSRWRHLHLLIAFLLTQLVTSLPANAQTTVRGRITDETGAALPGVNVIVKNTTSGTTTDSDGNYTIQAADAGAVLVFSFIGYETKEVTVAGQSVVNIALSPSVESLSEVVVVGYGVQKKSDITGAMSNLSGKALSEVPVANVTQALQGRVAGVDINMTSPRPGGGAQIRIRGSRSLTGSNDPLIVVDGIPFTGTINDINPNDIASMDILKDASATAIYGSRGSNGVILITTRRGKEGKTQLYYDGYYGASSVVGKYDVMNGAEYEALRAEARAAGAAYAATPDEAANLAAGNEVDWQDEMYQGGYITNHLIGAQGGTAETKYNISAGYFKQTTVIPGQAFNRYSISGVIDQSVAD